MNKQTDVISFYCIRTLDRLDLIHVSFLSLSFIMTPSSLLMTGSSS